MQLKVSTWNVASFVTASPEALCVAVARGVVAAAVSKVPQHHCSMYVDAAACRQLLLTVNPGQ
jgi:hypothetical protein